VTFPIERECETDGRWLAEVPTLAGVMCYGVDRDEAVARVQALALRVIAERLEHREAPAEFLNVTFEAAAFRDAYGVELEPIRPENPFAVDIFKT